MQLRPLIYYITAHGYGHGVRSCDILNAFAERRPDWPIIVVSNLPLDFFKQRLRVPRFYLFKRSFDVGMVQEDAVQVNLEATLHEVQSLVSVSPHLLRSETDFLRKNKAGLVVVDIPSIPLEAAQRAKVPAVAAGNFGWDWIYEEFAEQDPRWWPAVEMFERGYSKADLLLRMPLAEPMEAFTERREVNITARPGQPDRDRVTELTGADPAKRWVLLSFARLDVEPEALARIETNADTEFFVMPPMDWAGSNIYRVSHEKCTFSDMLASMDGVISKPGYGLLSDCIANNKPLLYTERTHFREYDVLVEHIKEHLSHAHIPSEDLYRGELAAGLQRLWQAPPPRSELPLGGDMQVAEQLQQMLEEQEDS